MLRILFGEQPREWTGAALETVQSIVSFAALSSSLAERRPEMAKKYRTFAIGAEGLLRSMDEFEQSCYAARRYASQINHSNVRELSQGERLSYDRHVYFDKNAYIRVFALLDKLGTLLNQLLDLRTERFKVHYSFYTMLRNMRENGLFPELMNPLNQLKERHQGAMNRLRNRRNVEIHQMNAELKDDLHQSLTGNGARTTLENLEANLADLDQGWEMIQGSLFHAFRFGCKYLRKMK
ncbi:Cthe_2314 family HEPN domain-containing protein [Cohnella terricola]|uniref:Cthe-2314-like HEPN domain-containing protein n=1 Tax=Cohnella terricola TaxID=1289167 RepID=A0A559JFS9_9BACL|nr:Cthe_2314 family HEPN domain-containing protein [Cohnella terricola]TVX98739.1 hypothetical protein FPZ45_15700 [Cohnella terricola]